MRRPDANSASIELPDIESQSPEIQDFLRLVRDRFGIDFDSTMGRVISTIPRSGEAESMLPRWRGSRETGYRQQGDARHLRIGDERLRLLNVHPSVVRPAGGHG